MDAFADCLCNENYKRLVIDGEPTQQEIQIQWQVILSEYHQLKSQNGQLSNHWLITVQIIRLQNHLTLVEICIGFLKERYSDSIVKDLRRMGYKFKTESIYPDDYMQQLFEIWQLSKSKYIEIQQLSAQLKKELAKTENKKVSYNDFENSLLAFEQMQKTSYSLSELTVSKFISLENRYSQYIELLNSKKAQ